MGLVVLRPYLAFDVPAVEMNEQRAHRLGPTLRAAHHRHACLTTARAHACLATSRIYVCLATARARGEIALLQFPVGAAADGVGVVKDNVEGGVELLLRGTG